MPRPRQNFVAATDLGRRVSFQFELPNGFIREVVGTLEDYDRAAQTFMVRDRAGELVRVPEIRVRFGRVVS
jgi:hypothetical protein